MRRSIALSHVFVVAALSACGGDDDGGSDILGLYATTEHVASEESCSGGEAPDPAVPYFRIVEDEILGQPYFTRKTCTGTDLGSCGASGGILIEPVDGGYTGYGNVSSGDVADCSLSYITFSALLDGETLTYETYTYSESGAIDPCDTAEAEARGEDMPCTRYEIQAGTRQ